MSTELIKIKEEYFLETIGLLNELSLELKSMPIKNENILSCEIGSKNTNNEDESIARFKLLAATALIK